MTEVEFMASTDPAAMLEHLRSSYTGIYHDVSDRKLRLFACACCWGASADLGRDAERIVEAGANEARRPELWARGWAGDQARPTAAERAAILRDIVGNPFRPVALCGKPPQPGLAAQGHCDYYCPDCAALLTPTVVSLATQAYQERPGRECGKCPKWEGVKTDEQGYYETDAVQAVIDFGKRKKACVCQGTGRIDDGQLDHYRLAVLSDALEEAGCEGGPCVHCQGRGCHQTGMVRNDTHGRHDTREAIRCLGCNGTGRTPHPLVAHLRSPEIHVRGCWAIDLLTGRE
jgi:hypothetical protein